MGGEKVYLCVDVSPHVDNEVGGEKAYLCIDVSPHVDDEVGGEKAYLCIDVSTHVDDEVGGEKVYLCIDVSPHVDDELRHLVQAVEDGHVEGRSLLAVLVQGVSSLLQQQKRHLFFFSEKVKRPEKLRSPPPTSVSDSGPIHLAV